MKIAVIGSGISGLSCAWLLDKHHEVTLFEKNNYLGGHANTATIQYPALSPKTSPQTLHVDTGFIVFNFRTYPNLKAFFELLDVNIAKSHMSFGIKHLDNGLEYSGNSLSALFAQKQNLFNPAFLSMLIDIVRFNKKATEFVEREYASHAEQTLGEFIDSLGLGEYFKQYYLLPMAGAIWSCPLEQMKAYPAKTFLQFFYNHGLLTITDQPQWYTITNGSKQYVDKIIQQFKGTIYKNCELVACQQDGKKLHLTDAKGNQFHFDHVIFATHSDQTYALIQDKSADEKRLLGAIGYSANTAILHRDETQMPVQQKAWSSWVYLAQQKAQQVSLTYWMNQLQNIDQNKPLFVTLNPIEPIDEQKIFASFQYEHPIFDQKAILAQEELSLIQGKRRMWFCGAWTKYGFHEDGINSAIEVAKHFNVPIPW